MARFCPKIYIFSKNIKKNNIQYNVSKLNDAIVHFIAIHSYESEIIHFLKLIYYRFLLVDSKFDISLQVNALSMNKQEAVREQGIDLR